MSKYQLSTEAKQDLENIWFYTRDKWSLEQAERYLNLLVDEIEHLAAYPQLGKEYSEVRKGYWRVRAKSHFIFYRVASSPDDIEIIRILHYRMDIDVRLSE